MKKVIIMNCPKQIENRYVRICKGSKTQTVNICTSDNKWGVYDLTLRLPVVIDITCDDIEKHKTIDNLVEWLVSKHEAKKEIAVQPPEGVEVEILEPALEPAEDKQYIDHTFNDVPWITKAVVVTESCIDELLEEFLERPYLHRVEHSLHTRLYELLHSRPHFDRHFQSKSGIVSQPIHKEWPESKPRQEKADRRGNFDIAILCPGQFIKCKENHFKQGLLTPPIAIEMGLNYGMSHLLGDADKLINSRIQHGYLIHLVRGHDQLDDAKNVINDLYPIENLGLEAGAAIINPNNPSIKIAFAQVNGNQRHIKRLDEPEIGPL